MTHQKEREEMNEIERLEKDMNGLGDRLNNIVPKVACLETKNEEVERRMDKLDESVNKIFCKIDSLTINLYMIVGGLVLGGVILKAFKITVF